MACEVTGGVYYEERTVGEEIMGGGEGTQWFPEIGIGFWGEFEGAVEWEEGRIEVGMGI